MLILMSVLCMNVLCTNFNQLTICFNVASMAQSIAPAPDPQTGRVTQNPVSSRRVVVRHSTVKEFGTNH